MPGKYELLILPDSWTSSSCCGPDCLFDRAGGPSEPASVLAGIAARLCNDLACIFLFVSLGREANFPQAPSGWQRAKRLGETIAGGCLTRRSIAMFFYYWLVWILPLMSHALWGQKIGPLTVVEY